MEKQRLDEDRMERQFLERERLRIEYERRREQERIMREREELRRQQEQLRFDQDRRPVKRPYDMDGRWVKAGAKPHPEPEPIRRSGVRASESLGEPSSSRLSLCCVGAPGKTTGLINAWPWTTATTARTSAARIATRTLTTGTGAATRTT